MNLTKSFELAFLFDDVLSKVLPILKFINQTIPFPSKHNLIYEPKIVKYLLQLHKLIPDTIDMVLSSLLNIFKTSQEWVDGCLKSIEEYGMMSNSGDGKFYALDYLENVITEIAEYDYNIDEKLNTFIVFLQYADSEKLVRNIMQRVQEIQEFLGHKLKQQNKLNQLMEETVLKLYQEEIQKNSEEFQFQNLAIELQEKEKQQLMRRNSKPKLSQIAINIMNSQQTLQPPKQMSKQIINLDDSQESIKNNQFNIDEILIQQKPRIDSDQSEYFQEIDTLSTIFAYITNPIASEPSLLYETDFYANKIKHQCDDSFYRLHVIKPDKLTTLRSYKTMLFLTDYHNHQMIVQINTHAMQIALRSISGFFQNSQSNGNLNHIIGLLHFYLKFEQKDTIYNFLYSGLHITFLDYLYNPLYFDFLLRLLDPYYLKIPNELKNFIWNFMNRQNYVTHLVNKIVNQEKIGIYQNKREITKDGFQQLKNITDYKLTQLEDDEQLQLTYSASTNLDQYLGPLVPGKTLVQNKQFLGRKMLLSIQRRNSDLLTLQKQINKVIVQEYLEINELNGNGKDIDKLTDVVNYYKELGTPAETPTLLNIINQTQEQFKRQNKQQVTEPPQNILKLEKHHKLPQLHIQTSVADQDLEALQRNRKSFTLSENLIILPESLKPNSSLISINEFKLSTYRALKTPGSQTSKVFNCYPNADNSVIDTIMKEEYIKYQEINDEDISYKNAHLLKCIIQQTKQLKTHLIYDELLDVSTNLLEKLLNHYSLTQIELESKYEENSSNECQIILLDLLNRLNQKPINEKINKIYLTYLPRICRNIVKQRKVEKEQYYFQSINNQNKQSNIGLIKLNSVKIIHLILSNYSIINHRIYLKLNDTSTNILNEWFHIYFTNVFYQQIFYLIIKQICQYAQEKQVLALFFKANLIEGISEAYQKCVINKVIIKDCNIEAHLLYLAMLAQLILQTHELRDDLNQYKSSLLRMQCYQKLKELVDMYKNNKLLNQQLQNIKICFPKKK